ncbi:MAG: hypothetical protein Kow0047_04300 [Anaerolineae bacterium]
MWGRPTRDMGQGFIEFAVILVLIAIVVLAILLIFGNDLRLFVNDLLMGLFPPS